MKQDRSILVVEDEQATRDLVCAQLGASYEVRSASNGEEALKAIEYLRADRGLVVFDETGPASECA